MGHLKHFWNFGTPYTSEMFEASNLKFGMDIKCKELYRKYLKLCQKWSWGVM